MRSLSQAICEECGSRAWCDATSCGHLQITTVPSIADAQLHCQLLGARIALGETAQVEQAVIERWLTAERLPRECEPLFEWLRTRPAMTEELIEKRVRLLLQNGETSFALIVARRLSPQRAAPLLQWADLLDNPQRSIDAVLAAPDAAVEHEALLAGWTQARAQRPGGRARALRASRRSVLLRYRAPEPCGAGAGARPRLGSTCRG